jgi:prepilin-type N-terminal cleavage/methylation domain-containing protein
MKNSRGFTLIELLVVVAIIAMIGTVGAVATIRARPNYQLQKAARDMITNFRNARSMAIKFNRPVTLRFNVSQGVYFLDGKRLPSGSATETMTSYYGGGVAFGFPGRSGGSGDYVHFTQGIGGADAGDSITFNTLGLTDNVVGYVYIQNQNSSRTGAGYRIGVSSLAANIKMDLCGAGGIDCTLNQP